MCVYLNVCVHPFIQLLQTTFVPEARHVLCIDMERGVCGVTITFLP